jgi:hypothetical protein
MAFKRIYVFFILELETRMISQFGITQFPRRNFVVNNLKSFMFDREEEQTYLIHDNSCELRSIDYSVHGIRDVATGPYSSDMNANVVKTYVHFYNHYRPHQGIGNRVEKSEISLIHASVSSKLS